jgi:hypothetical protein
MVAEFDSRTPSTARVWDSLTGGKDNFEPDREVRQRIEEVCPDLVKCASGNRDFLDRAVSYVAWQGVDQFIDLGAGFPRSPMPHESARRVTPGARVAYVDNDPQVLRHLGAWCGTGNGCLTVVDADAADHGRVLAALRGALDLSRPCGVIFAMMPHFFPADAARALTAAYLKAAAPGSYLIASTAYSSDERAPEVWDAYSTAVRPVYRHSPEVFATFFGPAELIPPGVGETGSWRPGRQAPCPPDTTHAILCGVARKR